MAKRNVPERYLEWAKDLPEEVRETAVNAFLNSKAADTVFNLDKAYTQATQRAAALEQEVNGYKPIVGWVEQNRDVLQHEQFPVVAQQIRANRNGGYQPPQPSVSAQQQNAQLSQDLAAVEQRHMDLTARVNTGELEWDKTQPILQDLVKYAGTLRQQQQQIFNSMQQELEQIRQTQERQSRDFPQLIANNAEQRMREQNEAKQLQREGVEFQLEVTDYMAKHRDRDVSRAIQEFRTGNYASFNQAAEAVFGGDDYEEMVQKRVDAALAKIKAEQPPAPENNGEGAMASFPTAIRRLGREDRSQAQAPDQSQGVNSYRKPFEKSRINEAVNDNIRDIIARGAQGLPLTP